MLITIFIYCFIFYLRWKTTPEPHIDLIMTLSFVAPKNNYKKAFPWVSSVPLSVYRANLLRVHIHLPPTLLILLLCMKSYPFPDHPCMPAFLLQVSTEKEAEVYFSLSGKHFFHSSFRIRIECKAGFFQYIVMLQTYFEDLTVQQSMNYSVFV